MRVVKAVLMFLLRHPGATEDDLRTFADRLERRHPTVPRAMILDWWRPYLKPRGLRLKTGRPRAGAKRPQAIDALTRVWPRDRDGDRARGFWAATLAKVRRLEGAKAPKSSETLRQWSLDDQKVRPMT
jgi:hypothetical protein